MTEEKRTLTIEEVAKKLGIGRNQAYSAARNGQLPTIKVGNRVLVPLSAFENWLEFHAAAPKQIIENTPMTMRTVALQRVARNLLPTATDDQLKQIISLLLGTAAVEK